MNTCLITLRFAHSMAPAVNTRSYPGTTIRKTSNEKNILHVIQNEMPVKFSERK